MNIYTINLAGLLALSIPVKTTPFLVAYTLAMTSDWLQGPFQHHLPPSLIPRLFTAGFLASALSSAPLGRWADRHGRKRACLAFCAVYALSCLLTTGAVVPGLGVAGLVAGRVLGGVGTGVLFVGFESWVVGEFSRVKKMERRRGEDGKGGGEGGEVGEEMGRVFGVMSGLNSAAAIDENYGEAAQPKKDEKGGQHQNRAWSVLSNPRILALGAASTVFEGSMYLFVFFWAPVLKSVQSSAGELPYGVIFASFMAATLASSLVFNFVTERRLIKHTTLLVAILGISAACFILSAKPQSEQSAFWVFCLFEAAVGMYWPCMGFLKGRLIEDGVRAQVYGLLRIPLNIFVVVSLLFTRDSDAFGRVFPVCASLLLASSGAVWALMEGQAS
ncbi:hypothetical protein NEMBOFW57_008494 [Staphylotrichum longicolle]|uniref:Molybdate-anion transporter n=1 Tax=Staphylotrichum longicolle TaxID=669026 RepID=A0AAD4HYZ3_9PEZI|nr:hypothetical protein NEMBOFW57_008494 [Staphylotrichum longicolle]